MRIYSYTVNLKMYHAVACYKQYRWPDTQKYVKMCLLNIKKKLLSI